jgi:hypothetical protein
MVAGFGFVSGISPYSIYLFAAFGIQMRHSVFECG